MDRLTSMAVFVRAVELGSFAAAADAFEMSGPMVGKHVRFLEGRLGVRLLNRTTRRQSPTEAGQAYYDRCRAVLSEAEAADAAVFDELSEPRGKLRVTMPALLGRHCVAPLLMKLARRYPHLELDLSFGEGLTVAGARRRSRRCSFARQIARPIRWNCGNRGVYSGEAGSAGQGDAR